MQLEKPVAFEKIQAIESPMALVKTDEGQQAFKARSPLFSNRQRAAFILFDGVKSMAQVLAASSGLGVSPADVDHMLSNGFLKENAATAAIPSALSQAAPATQVEAASAGTSSSSRLPQERYAQAWPVATQLTASLGLRGFRLNLAVEAASGYEDLLALFPKIQAAVGVEKAVVLEQALKG
jgi:hypothetical protein